MSHGIIAAVRPGSLAEELGLMAGDAILAVNGQPLKDIIDFSFAFADTEIDLTVRHSDGEEEIISFDKDEDEELGAEFGAAVFDGIRPCANSCYFCFVRQLPPGLRPTLAVKDDDYRLSFLYGNFVTLTNMQEEDFRRIAALHLTPLFVSVHTMNGALRAKMLRSPRAADIAADLDKLAAVGVSYHAQIVLCPGLNDGKELDFTIGELISRRPQALSLAIVPVGLTKFRRDSYPLRTFEAEGAAKVIAQVEAWQGKLRQEGGQNFVYLGDEFYLLAGKPLPPVEAYDDFPQLDNGIGLVRNFWHDWETARRNGGSLAPAPLVLVSGTSFAPVLKNLLEPDWPVQVLPIANELFGERVTVSGLLAGRDIERTLSRIDLSDKVGIVLPASALRSGEDVFVDDYSLRELRQKFRQIKIEAVAGGDDLWRALTDWPNYHRQNQATYLWQSGTAYDTEIKKY